jgi:hypothetical protein
MVFVGRVGSGCPELGGATLPLLLAIFREMTFVSIVGFVSRGAGFSSFLGCRCVFVVLTGWEVFKVLVAGDFRALTPCFS